MPRTRSSASSDIRTHQSHDDNPDSQTILVFPTPNDKIPCPFTNFDGCHGGVGGKGYSKSGLYRHLKDQHFPTESDKEVCRGRIKNIENCFVTWERVLSGMQSWLCIKCMNIHAWKMACKSKSHHTDVIIGPFNGVGADFLIYGDEKPHTEIPVTVDNAVPCNPNDDETMGLTVELLNKILQKQITTTVSIPPPCRLHFSRTLKSSLDFVLANPLNLAAWIRLLLLPACTLNLYVPKSSSEECSGNRKKLQMVAINTTLLKWKEPSGCVNLAQQLLGLTKQTRKQHAPCKKKKNKNLMACRRKLSYGHLM